MKGKITFLLFCLAALAACSDEDSKLSDEDRKLKKELIAGCAEQAGDMSHTCPCMIGEMQKKYSISEIYILEKEFIDIGNKNGGGFVFRRSLPKSLDTYISEAEKAAKKCD